MIRRRRLLAFSAASLFAAGVAFAPLPARCQAPEPSAKREAAGKTAQNLPLTDVVLFSSGVGYFERNAAVEGDATVELKFPTKDVNDLLKSLVAQDFDGGKIAAVSYASQDPIEKTLGTFAIDLRSNPTLGGLLAQVRGERVLLSIPDKVEGTIVGYERENVAVKDKTIVVEKLTLLTEEGLRSIDLARVQQVRLLRPELEAELKQALKILASGHDADKKAVSLRLQGQGKRTVRVGYIVESPVWKTSYRLVLGKEKALLQGWAIVENTTEEDWDKVQLTLVSGRPISFRMDLYSPLYVQRPLVEPELYASLRPQTYDQSLGDREEEFRRAGANRANEKQLGGRLQAEDESLAYRRKAANGAPADGAYAFGGEGKGEGRGLARDRDYDAKAMAASVTSAAQGGEVGELFRYSIEAPVKIARRQSAMIPIVSDSIQLEKVSIYNEQVQPKHPLNGFKLKNSTGQHLLQGPITVFDDGVYAGDAKIEDLAPGAERLVSYALDLDVEVAPTGKSNPDEMLSVKLVYGTLQVSHRAQTSRTYTVKNSGTKERKVLVEVAKSGDWKLLSPKEPAETTRDRYRFAVQAKPGEPAVVDVVQQREYANHYAVSNLDENALTYYVGRPVSSPAVKKALADLIALKRELARISGEKNKRQQEIGQIDQEQNRIRQNMPQLDRASDLYARYVKKFNEQEDRIEALRTELADLIQKESAQQKLINEFIAKTNLE